MNKMLILPFILTSMQAYASDKQEDNTILKTTLAGLSEATTMDSSLLRAVEEYTKTGVQAPQADYARTDLFIEYYREDKVRQFSPGEIAYSLWQESESNKE